MSAMSHHPYYRTTDTDNYNLHSCQDNNVVVDHLPGYQQSTKPYVFIDAAAMGDTDSVAAAAAHQLPSYESLNPTAADIAAVVAPASSSSLGDLVIAQPPLAPDTIEQQPQQQHQSNNVDGVGSEDQQQQQDAQSLTMDASSGQAQKKKPVKCTCQRIVLFIVLPIATLAIFAITVAVVLSTHQSFLFPQVTISTGSWVERH